MAALFNQQTWWKLLSGDFKTPSRPAPKHWGSRLKQVFVESILSWFDQRASSKGAALAFYTLFSMTPILLLAIAIASYFFGAAPAKSEIASRLHNLLGDPATEFILALLKSTESSGSGFAATVVASVLLLLAATSAFAELKGSLDELWGIGESSKPVFIIFVRTRLLSFALVLFLAFLLLVSILLSAGLGVVESYADRVWGNTALLIATTSTSVISFIVTACLFALIYKALPEVPLSWRDVGIGALFTAGLFGFGKFAIGFYLTHSNVTSGFGAAGSLVALMLWVYYSAQIFFFGAVFTRRYALSFGSLRHTDIPEGTTPEALAQRLG